MSLEKSKTSWRRNRKMKHVVSIVDFDNGGWANTSVMASSFMVGENKRLIIQSFITKEFLVESSFVVESKGVDIWVGDSLRSAIQAYNEA